MLSEVIWVGPNIICLVSIGGHLDIQKAMRDA